MHNKFVKATCHTDSVFCRLTIEQMCVNSSQVGRSAVDNETDWYGRGSKPITPF